MSTKHVLPEGWEMVKLKEISESIQYGFTESSSKNLIGPKFLRITDIQDNQVFWDDVPYCRINEEKINKYLLRDGDLVFARTGATVGKSFLIKGNIPEAIFASYLIRVRVKDVINERFLSYFFHSTSYWSQITEGQVGIGQPNVNGTKLGELDLPLPPVRSQQNIVSKIEELFSEIDKGIETLRTAQQQLKVYRQAVLKWAFEGKLTNDSVKAGELPEEWELTKLGQYIADISSGKSYRCNERPPQKGEIGIIKVSSVTWGFFDENESKTCFSNDLLNKKYVIKTGDFLFSRANTIELIGACVIVKHIDKQLMLSDKILRFTFSKEISKHYILYYLRSRKGRKQIESLSTGNQDSMRNIGQEKIRQIQFPFCSIEEQKQIIEAIECRLSIADKMEETIAQSLQQAEVLKQSILKQAFEGKLTPPAIAVAKKSIPLPPPVIEDPYARKVFAAYIISKCYDGRHFGKVVFQKTLHLAEYHCQCDYETAYLQKAAGPLDEFINRFIEEAAEKGWFTTHLKNRQIRFEPGPNMAKMILDYYQIFVKHDAGVQQILQLVKNETLDGSELYSTVYAVWNNCLINGIAPTKERIMKGVYDWSDRKGKFSELQIWDAKALLERRGLVPMGLGKIISNEA